MAEALDAQPCAKDYLRKALTEEWRFLLDPEALDQVSSLLGVKDLQKS